MSSFFSAAVVSLVLWAVSFLYFRAYVSRRTSSQRILSEFRDEVEKLVSEIDAATDRDVQLVEDRMKALRALLEETDKRVGTMRREIDRRSSEERAYSELGKRSRPIPLFSPDEAVPEPRQATAPSVAERQSSSPEPQKAHVPSESAMAANLFEAQGEAREARFIRAQLQVAPKEPPFAEQVAELNRAGFSSEIIAARLGKTVGEVDLAIALSGKLEKRNGDDTGH
jgi:hypothetical protein